MEYRPLGRTGVQVSQLCFGTMAFGGDADEPGSARMKAWAFPRQRESTSIMKVLGFPLSRGTARATDCNIGFFLRFQIFVSTILSARNSTIECEPFASAYIRPDRRLARGGVPDRLPNAIPEPSARSRRSTCQTMHQHGAYRNPRDSPTGTRPGVMEGLHIHPERDLLIDPYMPAWSTRCRMMVT